MHLSNPEEWVWTHDAAEQLLKYAAPGATVHFGTIALPGTRDNASASREFAIELGCARGFAASAAESYSLPFRAETMYRRVREVCQTHFSAVALSRGTPTISTQDYTQ